MGEKCAGPTVEYQVLRGAKGWCDVHIFTDEKQAKRFAKKGDEIRTVMRYAPPPKKGRAR